jgi:hypothetical protein
MSRGGAWSIVVTGIVLPLPCAMLLEAEAVPSVLTRFGGGELGGDLTELILSVFMLRERADLETQNVRREKELSVVAKIRCMVVLALNFLSSRDVSKWKAR